MSLEALGVHYAPLKGPEWAVVGVVIVTLAAVLWESWEAKTGNDRPVLKVAVGIMLSFLGGMSVELGFVHFRSGTTARVWILDILTGLVCLVLSITYFTRRKAMPGPRSIIEWLNERNKLLLLLDKKDD
jgi:FtsH-binding integral membrane protein